jgi:hypothetical protein
MNQIVWANKAPTFPETNTKAAVWHAFGFLFRKYHMETGVEFDRHNGPDHLFGIIRSCPSLLNGNIFHTNTKTLPSDLNSQQKIWSVTTFHMDMTKGICQSMDDISV